MTQTPRGMVARDPIRVWEKQSKDYENGVRTIQPWGAAKKMLTSGELSTQIYAGLLEVLFVSNQALADIVKSTLYVVCTIVVREGNENNIKELQEENKMH